ncbi:MAG: phage portal protein [Mangrovibacterium sp.]
MINIFTTLKNDLKAAVGYRQNFTDLLQSGDISRAVALMKDTSRSAQKALLEYRVEHHAINKRQDKPVLNKRGELVRMQKRWRLPIPYQKFINEIALVFIFGQPVRWSQESQGTDEAFQDFKDLLKDMRFNAKIRQCKRLAGAETVSALLFHLEQDNGKPSLVTKVLAKSQGDDIHYIKDQYNRLVAFAWGYYLTEAGNQTIYHVDILTSEKCIYCKRNKTGWDKVEITNEIGKIPVILFEQETEFDGVGPLIERKEWTISVNADVNDRFANPAMVATTEILNDLPKAEEEAKLYILKNGGEMNYLTWDQASENKKLESEDLEKHIMTKSFTPNLDVETMKGLSNISAKALKQMMILADIKAQKNKEVYDDYLDRFQSLAKAVMGVLNYSRKSQYDQLIISHEFQEPFGEDITEVISNLIKTYGSGGMSLQTFLESNPLIKDSKTELDRIKQDQQEAMERQKELNKVDVFGGGE